MKCPKRLGNMSFSPFYFSCFIEAVVDVYNHCQCCVPKHTRSFIPLLLPCTVYKPKSDVSEREVNIMFLLFQEEALFFFLFFLVKAGNHYNITEFVSVVLVSFFPDGFNCDSDN